MSTEKQMAALEPAVREPPPPYSSMYPDIEKGAGVPAQQPNPQVPTCPPSQPQAVTQGAVYVTGGTCPKCQVGSLVEEDNMCAYVCCIIMIILCFPIGLLYLFCLPHTKIFRCPRCNYQV